jgi:tetratricopeptide (TPR) repeat protein
MGRFRTALLCVALVALTVAAYAPVWKNGLVDFDDELYVTTNPRVMEGLSWSGAAWAFTNYHARYWQPVAWLSLQLDAQLVQLFPSRSRDERLPALVHGQNLFWHCASALLLFGFWQRLTGQTWRAFFVAVLFAVHPMHVESVAWAAERKDVLSVFFGVLTLWAYVGYVAHPRWMRYLVTACVFAISLMSKPMLVTLPFVLLLLDYWPLLRDSRRVDRVFEVLQTSGGHRRLDPSYETNEVSKEQAGEQIQPPVSWRWLLLEKVPLLLLAAATGVVTMVSREQTASVVSLTVLPLSARLANAAAGYGWYLASTFWPFDLAALYPHPGRSWGVLPVVEGLTAVLVITALAAWQARRRRWLIVGWLWFLGTLIPVIGLAQGGEQAWADRFSYWPHVGLFVAVAWALGELVERWRIPAGVCAVGSASVLACLAVMTWIQVGYWRDSFTLWTRAAEVTADNDVAHLHLGYYHSNRAIYFINLGVPEKAMEHFALAESHFAEAVRIHPESAEFRSFFGAVQLSLGKPKEAAAQLEVAVAKSPELADAWHNLGMARMRLHEPEAAVPCFRRVLELRPDPADAHPRAEAFTALGLAFLETGKHGEAKEAFLAALDLDPRQAEAWHGLGNVYLVQGCLNDAVDAFGKAVESNPGLAKAFGELGVALGRQGKWDKAVQALRMAVQLQEKGGETLEKLTGGRAAQDAVPDLVTYCCRLAFAQNQLGLHEAAAKTYAVATRRDSRWVEKLTAKAWQLATSPDAKQRDPRSAFELASQAAQANDNPPSATLDVLAAAHAALGQFPEAIQTAKRALQKARDTNDVKLANSIEERLKSYEKGLPATAHEP